MEEGPVSDRADQENAPSNKFDLKRAFLAAIARIPKPKTTVVTATVPQVKGRARKIQPSEWLLPVTDDEFNQAESQLKDKSDGTKLNKKKTKFSFSYIKIGGVVYALANGEYLGEGAYGKVKMVQDRTGRCFAVKIEGKGTYAEQEAETNIAKAVGYFRGRAERKLDKTTEFKGHEISTKIYTVVELRKGKEIFQNLYSTVLTPGQLYKDEDLKRKKRALTEAQKLIIAYKSCERTNDLHRRGIIHGDLKPANFMAAVDGNHIVVGSIDFGFSFRLDKASDQRVIVHPGAPNGTPLKYMPPEVRRAHASLESRQDAEFSFASDIYSLGIMFRDDIQLPKEVYEQMCADNANQRCSVTDAMKKIVAELEKIPENQRDPEITKIIEESKRGVRQKEKAEPQEKDTLVAQLMSGMRDPRETEGESRSINYTLDDFKEIAHIIYAKLKPEDFYTQLCDAYQKLDNIEDKKIFIHNAECFIKELIAMDVNQDFKVANQLGVAQFLRLKETENDNEAKALFDALNQSLQQAYNNADARKAKLDQDTRSFENVTDGEIDIQDYLKNQLAQSRVAGIGSRVNKIFGGKIVAIDTHEFKKHANAFAHDLREQQIALLKQLHASDYYGKKSLDRPWETAAYQKIVDLNNKISAMAQQDILAATSKSHQKRIFEFYFNVVEQSVELGDFATASTLFSMLEAGNVGRLEYLKEQRHLTRRYEKCRTLMSTAKNNKNLRDEFENRLAAGKVMIPPQSIVAGQSLLSIEDTIPTIVNNKTNEFKLSRLANQLMVAFESQSNLLLHETKPCKTDLVSRFSQPILDDGNLYQLSLKVQGRKVDDQTPAPQFDQAASNLAEQLKTNARERDQETVRANKLIADIQQAKVTIDALVVETAELADLMNAKRLCDLIAAAAADKNNSVKLAVKVNPIDKNKIEKIARAIAAKQPAQESAVPVVAEAPVAVAIEVPAAADEVPVAVADEAPVAVAIEVPAAADEVPVAVADEAPVAVAIEVPAAADEVPVAVAEEIPEAEVIPAAAAANVPVIEPIERPAVAAAQSDEEAVLQAKSQAMEIGFLQGNEHRVSATQNLENLLKHYVKAIVEAQSEDPLAVQKALPVVAELNEQIQHLINRVNTATQSKNAQIKEAAQSAKDSMEGMVEKYQDLNKHLDAKNEELSIGKKVKRKVKKLAKKVKRIARKGEKAKVKPKDTLGYINALRDETQKRTRGISAMLPVEPPQRPVEPQQRRVRFANEVEIVEPQQPQARFADEVEIVEPQQGREVISDEEVQLAVAPSSVIEAVEVPVAPGLSLSRADIQEEALPALKRMQKLLEEPKSKDRNQIEIDAMKMGVGILMALSKEKKPNTFEDIVKQASIVTDAHDPQAQILKEAARTIIAVLIPPKAQLSDLNVRTVKMQEKIDILKQAKPMTEKIIRKIKLREDIIKHMRKQFEELAKSPSATATNVELTQPVETTRAQPVTAAKRTSSRPGMNANAALLKNCIDEFQEMIENINDPKYKVLFKEGVDPKRTMLLILYELREIDPKNITHEQINSLYDKGKKYWIEDNLQPHKDNPLIKLKDQLPSTQSQIGERPNPNPV
ncbi:MAG: RasGEF domain-containing protein [Candidatus Berkiella sp.]